MDVVFIAQAERGSCTVERDTANSRVVLHTESLPSPGTVYPALAWAWGGPHSVVREATCSVGARQERERGEEDMMRKKVSGCE